MRREFLVPGFLVLCFIFLTLVYPGPAARLGDSQEYCAMLISWGTYLRPYLTEETSARIEKQLGIPRREGLNFFAWRAQTYPHLVRKGTELDLNHFWFYSLAAAVFYWPVRFASHNIGPCFMLLHIVLLLAAYSIIRRKLGRTAGLSLFFIVFATPLFWFINKVHTEFFTVMLVLIGVSLLVSEDFAASALSFAVASTQNPPFAILCLLIFVLGFWQKKWAMMRMPEALIWLASFVLAALHPAYYYLRLGILNPVIGATGTRLGHDFLSLKKMFCFIVDPDIGLLANWPLSLPLILIFAYLAVKKQARFTLPAGLFILVSVPILLWSQSRTGNFNHGGTFSISRYALWYFYVFFLMVWQIGKNYSGRKRVVQRVFLSIVIVLGLVGAVEFRPNRLEGALRPTWASLFLYDHLPGLYDPLPEIFIERYTGKAGPPARNVGAISNRSGNKVLVLGKKLNRSLIKRDHPVVAGCPDLDPVLVYMRAKGKFTRGRRYFYINGAGKELRQATDLP